PWSAGEARLSRACLCGEPARQSSRWPMAPPRVGRPTPPRGAVAGPARRENGAGSLSRFADGPVHTFQSVALRRCSPSLTTWRRAARHVDRFRGKANVLDPKGADRVEGGFEATLGTEAGYSRPFGCLDCRGEAGLPHRFGELELSRIH